eukprot:CAMPEP_0173361660 /NCGR_PEP_ID=MMETSP1144-20121109/21332_1 /TAXON_ID=483371 /ORGANISM="non described non described, Strain CCMP2298" /LENGTH=76 /DNA_ID=CAMNT_0014311281 /DNA_START=3 /DNA_END=233 /DNA_ORIENTATION=-
MNWQGAPAAGTGVMQLQGGGMAAGAAGMSSANSNTLSYGSLKNRFLSGASKNNAPAGGSATGSGKAPASKLFALQR